MKQYPKYLVFSVTQADKPFSINEINYRQVTQDLFKSKLNFRHVDIVKNRISYPGFLVVINDKLAETALKLVISSYNQELYIEVSGDRSETRVVYNGGSSMRMGKLEETKPNNIQNGTLYLYDKLNRTYFDIRPVAFGAKNVRVS